jgi:hypothetical protein
LAKWALLVIELLKACEAFETETEYEQLFGSFAHLLPLEPFIRRFQKTGETVNNIMKVLKERGLTPTVNKICRRQLKKMQHTPKAKKVLQQWLSKHMKLQRSLPNFPTPVSSDVIESLFGRYKHILERTAQPEVNARVLVLPTMCGHRTSERLASC